MPVEESNSSTFRIVQVWELRSWRKQSRLGRSVNRERTWEGLEYYVKILFTGGGVSNDEGTGVAQEHWTLVNRQVQPMDE